MVPCLCPGLLCVLGWPCRLSSVRGVGWREGWYYAGCWRREQSRGWWWCRWPACWGGTTIHHSRWSVGRAYGFVSRGMCSCVAGVLWQGRRTEFVLSLAKVAWSPLVDWRKWKSFLTNVSLWGLWMKDKLGLLFLNASLLASVRGSCVIHLFDIDILRFMERIKKLSCVLLLLLYGYLLGFSVVHCCRKL